jgi:hypothetical protein
VILQAPSLAALQAHRRQVLRVRRPLPAPRHRQLETGCVVMVSWHSP